MLESHIISYYLTPQEHQVIPEDDIKIQLNRMFKEFELINLEVKEYIIENMTYRDYLKTYMWNIISEMVKFLNNFKCSKCGAEEKEGVLLNAHHKNYKYIFMEYIGIKEFNSLVSLCYKCHYLTHNKWRIHATKRCLLLPS